MNPTTHSSPSRAEALWGNFVGMFGGDAVERRYGVKPPPEWTSLVASLKDYELERGIKRITRMGLRTVPSLPEFARACRQIADDSDEPLRAAAPMLERPWSGDEWDLAANKHLLGHVARQAERGRHYVSDAHRNGGGVDALSRRLTAVLVDYKNRWARVMREEPPDEATQRKSWEWHMAEADEACNAVRASCRK